MPEHKYTYRVDELSSIDLDSPQAPLDISLLNKLSFRQKLDFLPFVLFAKPLPAFAFLRQFLPVAKWGNKVVVTRIDNVREILENDDVFGVPFAKEMRVVGKGKDFILGLDGGAAYTKQQKCIFKCFDPTTMKERVATILETNKDFDRSTLAAEFDPFEALIKPLAIDVCKEFFGCKITDEKLFYESTLAVSSFLFADVFGSVNTRNLAMTGAQYLLETIAESERQYHANVKRWLTKNKREDWTHKEHTALENLVFEGVDSDEISAIMIGMLLGFLPTTILATGKALRVFLEKGEARKALVERVNHFNRVTQADEKVSADAAIDSVIAEAMRFRPIQMGPFRVCKQDYKVKNVDLFGTIKAGSLVIPSTHSAMFDDKYDEAPDEFNPDRDSEYTMVFGHGKHWCVGAPMAQMFTNFIFKELFALPKFRVLDNVGGIFGKLKRNRNKIQKLGIFPNSIKMQWDKVDHFAYQEQIMSTIVIPLSDQDAAQRLKTTLSDVGHLFSGSDQFPSTTNKRGQLIRSALDTSGIIHFMSCAVIDEFPLERKGKENARLVIEISADKTVQCSFGMVADSLANAGLDLDIRTAMGSANKADLAFDEVLKENCVGGTHKRKRISDLYFNGTPGYGVRRVREEQALHDTIRQELSALPTNMSPLSTMNAVRGKLQKAANFNWAFIPVENHFSQPAKGLKAFFKPSLKRWYISLIYLLPLLLVAFEYVIQIDTVKENGWNIGYYILAIPSALTFTIIKVLALLAIVGFFMAVCLRKLEKNDPLNTNTPDQKKYDAVTAQEDLIANNHLYAVSRLKSGKIRWLVFRGVMFYMNLSAKYRQKPGIISDLDTIHFARWVHIPGTKHLMFQSNYGGSWESYLEDFITKSSTGLTSIWSNTFGFPRTRDLLQRGAKQSEGFKNWARRQQLPTPLWYVAYPNITTLEIRKNAAIRDGLCNIDNEQDAQKWLDSFGSVKRPEHTLDKTNIQSLVFSEMGQTHKHSHMLFVKFNNKTKRVHCSRRRSLMTKLNAKTHFGDNLAKGCFLQLAFSHRGLVGLGLQTKQPNNQSFPNAFVQDTKHETRSRILGDVGDSSPIEWLWGNENKPIDMVVICYSKTLAQLTKEVTALRNTIKTAGATVEFEQQCEQKKRGAFGFKDGVSQPIIKGTQQSFTSNEQDNLIEPGEFICGYPDERGNVSASPLIGIQGKGRLGEQQCASEKQTQRDFGFNGSYLVIRQIEQDVDGFNGYCNQAAKTLAANKAVPLATADFVAEKLIGRRKDGRAMTSNNANDEVDNNFRYQEQDPQGLACPLGSHVRRANPRDSLGKDSDLQMGLVNRHRLLRVGRSYLNEQMDNDSKGSSKSNTGIMFMCLNANIERQFEFVQQTWLQNTKFNGLYKASDPLSAGKCPMNQEFALPTPNGNVALPALASFTTVKGSGYFFLPSRQSLALLASL
jgi:Dyp-type peroxidase family